MASPQCLNLLEQFARSEKESDLPANPRAEDLTLNATLQVEDNHLCEALILLESAGGFGPALLMRRRLVMSFPRLFRPGMPCESELLIKAQAAFRREAGDAFVRRVVALEGAAVAGEAASAGGEAPHVVAWADHRGARRRSRMPTALWLAAYWLDLICRDRQRAVELYRSASASGCIFATDCLGWSYFTGNGVPVNYGEAARLSRDAADAGDSQARNNFAWGFYRGLGLPTDMPRAVALFRQSSEEGNALATCNLGYCYEMGTGVARDLREARALYERAAARGLPEALFNLALFECRGTAAAAPNLRRAADLLRLSAKHGYRDAERQLLRFLARPPATEQRGIGGYL